MKVLKHSRITEDSCLALHGKIQLQFLVKRCCWREGKGAGWGVGRVKIQNAISLHINRDSCVWEPEPWPVARQPDSSVSHGHFPCQISCHYCWFSQFNFQCACLVWYGIRGYVCICIKISFPSIKDTFKSCWVTRQYLKRSLFEWVKICILFVPGRDINPQRKIVLFCVSYGYMTDITDHRIPM